MNTPAKLGGYGVVLAAVFAAALGVGAAVGPVGAADQSGPGAAGHGANTMTSTGQNGSGGHNMAAMSSSPVPQGLAVSADGYTLEPASTTVTAGQTSAFSFRILGPDARPLTDYIPTHERELHFIVVRRDLTGYQHLHPTRAADGTWSVSLRLSEPGTYEAFADFQPPGSPTPMTLATDLVAPGDAQPTALGQPSKVATVDGYTVTLVGRLDAARTSDLAFTVTTADGKPVNDLQPYLGAYGHLVALRVGDLAYLHVHPEGSPGDGHTPPGPDVAFHAEVPTAGTYGLFLDFEVDGVVHTAAFTAITAKEAS